MMRPCTRSRDDFAPLARSNIWSVASERTMKNLSVILRSLKIDIYVIALQDAELIKENERSNRNFSKILTIRFLIKF